MTSRTAAAALLATVAALAGCGGGATEAPAGRAEVQEGVLPDVVCMDLQLAQDTMQAAGFFNLASQDGTGKDRSQILDRNWVVTGQQPSAGEKPASKAAVVLTAVKDGEDNC